jgi:hypothetical protein
MKFKIKSSSLFLSDNSVLMQGVVNAEGDKARELEALCETSPLSVEKIGGSEPIVNAEIPVKTSVKKKRK